MIKIPFLWFLFHFLLLYQIFVSAIQEMLKIMKIFIKRTYINIKQGERFIFVKYFNVVHFLNVVIFGWKNFFWVVTILRVALLNWFNKSSRFVESFNDNELLWSFSRSIQLVLLLSVFVQKERNFLLLNKELKGKIVLKHFMQYQDSLLF